MTDKSKSADTVLRNEPDERVCVDKYENVDDGNVNHIVEQALKDYNTNEVRIKHNRHQWGPDFTVKVYKDCSQSQKINGYYGLEDDE